MGAENNEPVSTSRNLFGSTPDFRTSDMASAMLSITVEIRKFPVSLTTFAAGAFSSPQKSSAPWRRTALGSVGFVPRGQPQQRRASPPQPLRDGQTPEQRHSAVAFRGGLPGVVVT